jgi:purine-nucleoside phosphorylase
LADDYVTNADITRAAQFVTARTRHKPTVGLILGSGLNPMADEIGGADVIPYGEIPGFPVSTVEGHKGELVIGDLNGRSVLAMRGRAHYYEGYSMARVTLPVRVMRAMGIGTLVVTNAAGGVNVNFRAGDLMLITDQINLVGMAGLNPLRGPNDDALGPRFPDMTDAYDRELQALTRTVAREMQIAVREGVYLMLAGPSFESPADIRFVRMIGGDAVGMSTVPEVIVANHMGVKVLGISCITNMAAGILDQPLNHEEVIETANRVKQDFKNLVKTIIKKI